MEVDGVFVGGDFLAGADGVADVGFHGAAQVEGGHGLAEVALGKGLNFYDGPLREKAIRAFKDNSGRTPSTRALSLQSLSHQGTDLENTN